MTKGQEDKLSMFLCVCNVCNEFTSEWEDNLGFQNGFADFVQTTEKIQQVRQLQELNTKGFTQKKNNDINDLIKLTMAHAFALQVHASVSKDVILLNKVDYTMSDLKRSRDTILLDKCQLIYNLVVETGDVLMNYGCTKEEIKVYKRKLELGKMLSAQSRNTKSKKKIATNKLEKLFKEGDMILREQLDKLMFRHKMNNSDFYQEYNNARRIISTGVRRKVA